jgi:membrane protease YdiL (CAAX protease family)
MVRRGAVIAGMSEELLYRGFLTGWLLEAVPGLPNAAALAVSAAAFGLAHSYQAGRRPARAFAV